MNLDERILSYDRSGEHKGQNGHVLVIAGSEDYAGAAVLTATACEAILRSGADLVTACCPANVAWLVNEQLPDAITKKFTGPHFTEDHCDDILDLAAAADVILIGPGLGTAARSFAKHVIERTTAKKVIDADAIHAVHLENVEHAVITAHAHEYNTLLKNNDLTDDNLQDHLGTNIVLKKGTTDEIISATETATNTTGNDGMTKGGTGDVLAGLTAGFIAQGRTPFDAACAAAYLNGAVGDLLRDERGTTFLASDIVANLHRVYH